MTASTSEERTHVRSGVEFSAVSWGAGLFVVTGQVADTATTLYGLQMRGVREQNPILAVVIERLGAWPGLLLANVLALTLLVASVELGAQYCREQAVPEQRVRLFRACGYAIFALCSFAAAAHNLRILATV